MSTRAVIAVPTSTDGWRGRYLHFDGYPCGAGVTLQAIVRRDGLETALRVLLQEHHGWSGLDSAQQPSRIGSHDIVRGYGLAYAPDDQPDLWIKHDGDTSGAVWAYVLEPDGIEVLSRFESYWITHGLVGYAEAEEMKAL